MPDLNIHYSCVVDNDPKFLLQTHIFIHSLLALGISPEAIFINFVFDDEKVIKSFADKGVNVSVYSKFGDKKYCNKLVQFSNKDLLNCDYIFLCDCDIGFVKSLDALAKSNRNNIIGKVVDAANPPLPLLQSVFDHYDKNIGNVVDVHGGQSSVFNVNGGFIGFPVALFKSFGERWKHYALDMLNNPNLVEQLGNYSKHIDQISFSLAASEFKAFKNIDARFNFPIHSTAFVDLNKPLANDIHCIHYHDCFTPIGLIKKVNNTQVDSYIEQLNKTISVNFDNKLFWNFRYKYFPELGSGQGSRGEVKEQKRQLLYEFSIERFKSVLDIGCGDGETLQGLNIQNYTGVDISQAAIEQHKAKRETGRFIHAESALHLPKNVVGDLTLCFEVLIHQPTIEDFDATLSKVVAATSKRLIISGYESAQYLDKSHMCFFHRPLKDALINSGKFKTVTKVANYHNLAVYVADTNNENEAQKGQLMLDNKVLVCTGFHRSATSATANYLYDAGLPLGQNLMPGAVSNPKGHYEDLGAVKLHDEQLEQSATNWQFNDESQLQTTPGFLNTYVTMRNKQVAHWGVKDPRACLFLNEWHKALDGTGCFLFVARHWSSCIESLLHRHSKDFAHNTPNLNADNAGMKFWFKPELSAKMWLSYNQRIINFVKANKNVSLIITQRALFEGAPLIQTLNTRFGFDLDATVSSPFDADLLRDEANERIFFGLSSALQCQLNTMWSELLALATFKSDDEAPRIVKTQVNADLFDKVEQKILSLSLPYALSDQVSQNSLLNQGSGLLTREQLGWLTKLKTATDSVTVQKILDSAQAATLKGINITDWLPELQAKFDLDANALLAAAKLLARTKHYSDAINMFKTVVSLGVYYPYIDFMTAQCYESLALAGSKLELNIYLQKAEYFYRKALKANPNNAGFYVGYAQFLVFMDRSTEAKPLFEAAFEKSPNQPQVIIAYSRFLESIDDLNMALTIVGSLSKQNDNPALKAAWLRLKLKQDTKSGKLIYADKVKSQLKDKDLLAWLSQTCFLINAKSAETDFIIRCLGHWDAVDISK